MTHPSDSAAPEAAAAPAPAIVRYIDPEQLKKDVAIDLANLTTAMQQQTGLFVHYAELAVKARRQHDRAKLVLEILESQLDAEYRKTLKDENPKTTEGQIRAAVVGDNRWKTASMRVIDANQEFRMAEAVQGSFDQRRDMLLQIARDAAREQSGPMRVMALKSSTDQLLETMRAGGVGAPA